VLVLAPTQVLQTILWEWQIDYVQQQSFAALRATHPQLSCILNQHEIEEEKIEGTFLFLHFLERRTNEMWGKKQSRLSA